MKSAKDRLMTHAELTQAVTTAIVAALAAGMTREDVAAAVTRCVESSSRRTTDATESLPPVWR